MDLTPRLQVLVCTTARRLGHIDFDSWPTVDGVAYLVSCQNPDGLKLKTPPRRDIEVKFFANTGLSVNRNQAMAAARGNIVLIADDDIKFSAEGLKAIIDIYHREMDLDFATFRSIQPEQRVYPPHGFDLSLHYPHYHPISFEISFRRSAYMGAGLKFCELAGIGAPYLCAGEEELLLNHALRRGLRGRFYDIAIVEHPEATTSVRFAGEDAFLRTKGALLRVLRGYWRGAIRIPVEAMRAPVPFAHAFVLLCQGYLYSIRNRNKL